MSWTEVVVELLPCKSSLVALPPTVAQFDDGTAPQHPAGPLARNCFQLRWEEGAGDEDGAAFVFWSGVWSSEVKQASGQLTETIVIDPQFAAQINLLQGQKVKVRACPEKAVQCGTAHVSPADPSGWEIVELNPALLEQQMLNQVRIVWVGLTFPVWVNGADVMLTVDKVEPSSDKRHDRCETAGTAARPQCLLMAADAEVVVAPRLRKSVAAGMDDDGSVEAQSTDLLPPGVVVACKARVLPSTAYSCSNGTGTAAVATATATACSDRWCNPATRPELVEPDVAYVDFGTLSGLERVPTSCTPPVWIKGAATTTAAANNGNSTKKQNSAGPSATSTSSSTATAMAGDGAAADGSVDDSKGKGKSGTTQLLHPPSPMVLRLHHRKGVPRGHVVVADGIRSVLHLDPFTIVQMDSITELGMQPGMIVLRPTFSTITDGNSAAAVAAAGGYAATAAGVADANALPPAKTAKGVLDAHAALWLDSITRGMPTRVTDGGLVSIPIPASLVAPKQGGDSAPFHITSKRDAQQPQQPEEEAMVAGLFQVAFPKRASPIMAEHKLTEQQHALAAAAAEASGTSARAAVDAKSAAAAAAAVDYCALFQDCGARVTIETGDLSTVGGNTRAAAAAASSYAQPKMQWKCDCSKDSVGNVFVGAAEQKQSLSGYIEAMFGHTQVTGMDASGPADPGSGSGSGSGAASALSADMFGCSSLGGVLVTGPPGVGKTALATHVLEAAGKRLLVRTKMVDCRPWINRRVDVVKKLIRREIDEAEEHKPSVIFLENLDALLPASAGEDDGHNHDDGRAENLADFFSEAAANLKNVLLVATAKSEDGLHATLGETWVFEHGVELAPPNRKERAALLAHHVDVLESRSGGNGSCLVVDGLDFDALVASSEMEGYVSRDLEHLASRAVHQATLRIGAAAADVGTSVGTGTGTGGGLAIPVDLSPSDFEVALKGFTAGSLQGVKLHEGNKAFGDVGGLVEAKRHLLDTFMWPSRYPDLFAACPLRLRSGIMLYGPPGCGKTLLAGAAANECGLRFISVAGPELLNKYIGASEQAVRDVFERARAASPSILFFDEFDSIAPKRGHDSTGVTDRVVNQLLTELDGVEGLSGVYVLAATSRPELIDAALLRPGRLDKAILCEMPDVTARASILETLSSSVEVTPQVDWLRLAEECNGFSGADLKAVLSNAQLSAVHQVIGKIDRNQPAGSSSCTGGSSGSGGSGGKIVVTEEHLHEAAKSTRPSVSASDLARHMHAYKDFMASGGGGAGGGSGNAGGGAGGGRETLA